jgi:hypothetical protein
MLGTHAEQHEIIFPKILWFCLSYDN